MMTMTGQSQKLIKRFAENKKMRKLLPHFSKNWQVILKM